MAQILPDIRGSVVETVANQIGHDIPLLGARPDRMAAMLSRLAAEGICVKKDSGESGGMELFFGATLNLYLKPQTLNLKPYTLHTIPYTPTSSVDWSTHSRASMV